VAVKPTYPGVYIEEFAPGAPIEGVGTSTAAFIGPAKQGPPNQPTKITNWDAFRSTFGDEPLDGYYLWYAVRGFFENGGQVCYIVRVSSADFAQLILNDRSADPGQPTIRVWARESGTGGNNIRIAIEDAHAVSGAKVFRPTATIANATIAQQTSIKVTNADDAVKFRPGDRILLEDAADSETVTVFRVEGDLIRLEAGLTKAHAAGKTLRLADLKVGDKILRLENASKLAGGSVITLSQAPGGGAPSVTETQVVKSVDLERISPILTTYRVELGQGLANAYSLASDINVESQEFKLTVTWQDKSKPYPNLSIDPANPNYFATVINNDVAADKDDVAGKIYARSVEPPNTTPAPNNRPRNLNATALAGGVNDDPGSLMASHYKNALALLERIDDINMVVIPDRTDADVQGAAIAHCEVQTKDRFAILDSRRGAPLFGTGSVEVQRQGLDSPKGFAALYYPWILVAPAKGDQPILVPPAGHVAGIYARIDTNRGVFKAPAGTEAIVNGALGVERTMSDIEQGQLNEPLGINVIRVFQSGGRPVVWGARTTATLIDRNWQYVNIRRLFLFLEESIQEGIRWAVFEPNNLSLWQKLKRTIGDFLLQQWRDGALFGATPEEAFYVRIDEVLNPDSQRALGRLYIEIGIRPSYPAEFIIVRIGIWQGGSEVTEA
jgi:uncharacterized protein